MAVNRGATPVSPGAPRIGLGAISWSPVIRIAEVAFPFVVVAILWQLFALYGPMPPQLFPSVDKIAATFLRLAGNGILAMNTLTSLLRLVAGFGLGATVGVVLGLLMGRSRWAEDLLVPIVSVANPVPGLA